MEFIATAIPDVVTVDPVVHEDGRGFLMETWHIERFRGAGIDATFVQDVHSRSSQGTIRGLHYQLRQAQGKLIRAIRGEVFDVAVDLRRSSPTFGRWVGEILSEGNRRLIWVPPGFAHGFMVLSDFADIEYRMTDFHAPEHARAIRWDDPDIGVEWPLRAGVRPVLSDKDGAGVPFRDAEVYA
ncbi:MAG: dTDP-4-dehydrorhamnose 3,5-epimerase [Gammaproteobacteria bacterium]|nr:dTDP-4-dehydrorhamnose 3,5-epimerase [Gammaproteobacteria bacterium]